MFWVLVGVLECPGGGARAPRRSVGTGTVGLDLDASLPFEEIGRETSASFLETKAETLAKN